jgi:hypothetical protein
MPKRGRLQTSDDNPGDEEQPGPAAPPPPRKSVRRAAKIASTVASSKNMSRSDGYGSYASLDSGNNDNNGEKSLSSAALFEEVLKMVANKHKAELMILELMREYSFSFPRLKELLRRKLTGLESLVWRTSN